MRLRQRRRRRLVNGQTNDQLAKWLMSDGWPVEAERRTERERERVPFQL